MTQLTLAIMSQANPDRRLAVPVSDRDHVQGIFDFSLVCALNVT